MWKFRRDSSFPYQTWNEFKDCEKVEVANAHGDVRIGKPEDFWWGYEQEIGEVSEGTIIKARRID